MDAVEVIERACAERPELRLRPTPPRDEVDALETELGVPLPGDLRALLERAGGIDGGALGTIDFTGASFDVEISDIFPSGLPIAHDGSGNHWVLDLTPDAAPPPVFFASHDPPVVLLQSPDLAHFLDEVFADAGASKKSLVHEDRALPRLAGEPGRARPCSGARRRRRAARVRGDAGRPLYDRRPADADDRDGVFVGTARTGDRDPPRRLPATLRLRPRGTEAEERFAGPAIPVARPSGRACFSLFLPRVSQP